MPIRKTVDLLRLNSDIIWAGAEYSNLLLWKRLLHRASPKPDRKKPVLSIPGFSGPEFTLAPMTRYLRKLGFDAQTWGLGTNRGPKNGGLDHMDEIAAMMADKIVNMATHSEEKVSLIGHSLGGIYARELARRFPEHIDRVITLGSPAHLDVLRAERSVNSLVGMLFKARTGSPTRSMIEEESGGFHDMVTPPPGIPLVAIYSPYDGIVTEDTTAIPPEHLITQGGTARENIEIIASHCGMVVNPMVLITIADRLLADVDQWQAYDPHKYIPRGMKIMSNAFFPTPITKDMLTAPKNIAALSLNIA